ncbi:[citrate (pro-3S)-lyase] ligase [Vibrio salinus]|uniref:[citrate (pro-3S)-lyase] ligase n=1 Tax=Vibrio salinus TaxID=2899784 RepID=UPI001E632C87|nr:[citrate (pro-3S)-lyase] ligase [Vibrio salinus]MCE0492798.1 [citrate (pro-3S)-lyase] ligase [Vibrio salinus]
MITSYSFEKVVTSSKTEKMTKVASFLSDMGLGIDDDVEFFLVALDGDKIVACGGLAGNILKSIAVSQEHQGQGVSTTLLSELVSLAYEQGRFHLFIFTKPENYQMFHNAGFYQLTSVKDRVILLENSKVRLDNYCQQLSKLKHEGDKIGSIVMNANPFTFGHRYLVEYAASQCDWVHLFVVKEDSSFFGYEDRFNMIKAGLSDIKNVTIHPGSDYIISRATFPSYFLKDEGVVNYSHTAVDLQLFRNHIATALGITHRFVGTEPICKVTRFYNQQMHNWLTTPSIDSKPVTLVEIPRKEQEQRPISASLVRHLLFNNEWDELHKLVPETTYNYLRELFSNEDSEYQHKRKTAITTSSSVAPVAL